MRVYEGIVRDQVVVLPKDVHFEDGLRVEVRVPGIESESLEALFRQRLAEAGLLAGMEKPPLKMTPHDRTTIRVEGKPLSEQIIEERRQVGAYYLDTSICGTRRISRNVVKTPIAVNTSTVCANVLGA